MRVDLIPQSQLLKLPEVMVGGDAFITIRRRESYEDLVEAERV